MKDHVGSNPTFGTKNFMSFNFQNQREVSIDSIRWIFEKNDHLIVSEFSRIWVWESHYDKETDTLTIKDYENRDSVFNFSSKTLKAWIVPWNSVLMLEDTKKKLCETYLIYERIENVTDLDMDYFINLLKDKKLGLIKKPNHDALYILDYNDSTLNISYRNSNCDPETEIVTFNLKNTELNVNEKKGTITLKEGNKKFTAYPLVRLFGE